MSKLYVPIGIPGSGKSTWCRENLRAPCVSTDGIRTSFGDVNDQSNNDEVFRLYHMAIERYLQGNVDCVADATNLTHKARKGLYEIALGENAEVHLILFKNVGQAFARNAKRARRVPDDVMLRMLDNYERTLRLLPEERMARSWIKSTTTIASLD